MKKTGLIFLFTLCPLVSFASDVGYQATGMSDIRIDASGLYCPTGEIYRSEPVYVNQSDATIFLFFGTDGGNSYWVFGNATSTYSDTHWYYYGNASGGTPDDYSSYQEVIIGGGGGVSSGSVVESVCETVSTTTATSTPPTYLDWITVNMWIIFLLTLIAVSIFISPMLNRKR